MMFRISLAFVLISLFSFGANAQDTQGKRFLTQQPCGPWIEVMKTPKKYKEAMLFTGNGSQFSSTNGQMYNGGMFFFVNQETGSFSIINVYSDGMACLMQSGTGFAPYTGAQPWDKKGGGL
jgi:hypothetical protein